MQLERIFIMQVSKPAQFNRVAQPLAEAVMNDVVRGVLTGLNEKELDSDQIGTPRTT
jgi:hypothetical protein